MIYTQLDDKKLREKILRIKRNLDKSSDKTAQQLAEKGKWIAKFLAPKFTGKTSDYIIARKSPKRGRAFIVAKNPTAGRGNFNLVRWMHETNGVIKHPVVRLPNGQFRQLTYLNAPHKHIYSGDPKFMYSTRNELNKIKRQVAQANFNKINIQK